MRSVLAITHELHDAYAAAEDLAAQVRATITLAKESCAILFAEPGYDWERLLLTLQKKLGIPVVGCTATAQISTMGYHALTASLLVLTADDCVFGTALATHSSTDNRETFRNAYLEARAQLQGEEPVVAFVFAAKAPDFSDQECLRVLEELAGDIPVFGGFASDYLDFTDTCVFHKSNADFGGISIVLAGGNIHPKFVVRTLPTYKKDDAVITYAEGTAIHTINNVRAYDFMVEQGFDPSNPLGGIFTPVIVQPEAGDTHTIPLCVPLPELDSETGICQAFTDVPDQAKIAVQAIQGTDILESTRDAMQSIMASIHDNDRPEGYVYSTILGVTCLARHIVLGFDHEREGKLAREIFPDTINFSAFYSFGEFCPLILPGNKLKTRLHNLSFVLCAF